MRLPALFGWHADVLDAKGTPTSLPTPETRERLSDRGPSPLALDVVAPRHTCLGQIGFNGNGSQRTAAWVIGCSRSTPRVRLRAGAYRVAPGKTTSDTMSILIGSLMSISSLYGLELDADYVHFRLCRSHAV